MRRLAKLVGSRFLDDAGAFLVDFQDVLAGFLARAQAVDKLLRGPDVGFLLVLAPEVAAIDEALYFHERLRAAGIRLAGFVANRVQPAPGLTTRRRSRRRCRRDAGVRGPAGGDDRRRGGASWRRWRARSARCRCRSGASWRAWRARAAGIPITEVPLLDHDVDNLAELRVVGEHLSARRA